jgi:hypothetical protein
MRPIGGMGVIRPWEWKIVSPEIPDLRRSETHTQFRTPDHGGRLPGKTLRCLMQRLAVGPRFVFL